MKLCDLVSPDAIIAQLRSQSKNDVIAELVDALVAAGAAPKKLRDDLIATILEREEHGSTGFGKGVAVPHAKHKDIKKIVAAVGVSAQGVDFNALDKKPVHSIILLLSPQDQPDEHLQAMEKIFSNLQNDIFRRFLRQTGTAEEIQELLADADAQQFQT